MMLFFIFVNPVYAFNPINLYKQWSASQLCKNFINKLEKEANFVCHNAKDYRQDIEPRFKHISEVVIKGFIENIKDKDLTAQKFDYIPDYIGENTRRILIQLNNHYTDFCDSKYVVTHYNRVRRVRNPWVDIESYINKEVMKAIRDCRIEKTPQYKPENAFLANFRQPLIPIGMHPSASTKPMSIPLAFLVHTIEIPILIALFGFYGGQCAYKKVKSLFGNY